MSNDLETILDVCVSQIETGASNIDECLARYPEHAAQLKPLLKAATTLTHAREVMPSPAFKARARTQLSIYMQQNPQRRRISPVLWRFTIALATVMLLFIASGTTFAQGALPGDALYDWKLTSESVWRMTTSDPLGVDIALSNRRVYELIDVSGDQVRRARAVENYEKILIKFNSETDARDQARIQPILRSQHDNLRRAGVSVPELEIYFPR